MFHWNVGGWGAGRVPTDPVSATTGGKKKKKERIAGECTVFLE